MLAVGAVLAVVVGRPYRWGWATATTEEAAANRRAEVSKNFILRFVGWVVCVNECGSCESLLLDKE